MLPDFLFSGVTVICLGADRATKGVFVRPAGQLGCARHETVQFAAATPVGAEWVDRACAAIEALRRDGAEAKPVVLVLPPTATLLKHLRLPRVAARKRARLVAFEAGQNIPCAPVEVVWDSVLSGENPTTQDVLLVAAKLGLLERLCAAAQAAGFDVQRIVPEALAALAACRITHPVRSEPELLLHCGAGAATLLHLWGGNFSARAILLGGLGSAAADAAADRLASEVTRTLLHFHRQCGAPDPIRILFSWDSAGGGEVVRTLEQRLARSVQRWAPEPFEAAAPEVGSPDQAWERFVMTGAAALHSRAAQGAVNLLPPGRRQQQRRRGRQPGLVASILLLLVTPVGPLLHFQRLARAAETSRAAIEAEIAPWRARESRNRSGLAQLAELERRIAAVQAVQDRRSAWLRLLADLQERLTGVEDVWFERLRLVPATKGEPLKLAVAGRMLVGTRPAAEPGPEEPGRVTALLASLKESPFVAALEDERFDGSQPGLLAFEFVLVTGKDHPL